MKSLIRSAFGIATLCAALTTGAYAQGSESGFVDFGKLTPSVSGGEFVEVNIKSNLISMVLRLAQKAEPEVADLLKGLKQIRVNVIGLEDDNRGEIQKRIKTIRTELDTKGWERVATAQKKDEDVSVYLKLRGDEAVEGLVVTVVQGSREAVLVNIVGDIKPEKLAEVGERFNIEPLKQVARSIEK